MGKREKFFNLYFKKGIQRPTAVNDDIQIKLIFEHLNKND